MTTSQMQLNSELFGAPHAIADDENLMKRAVKSLKRLASEKKTNDETVYIMYSPAMMEILKQGKEDIKNGKGTIIEIEDLWK